MQLSARPARFGAISTKVPYSSTLRTMPTTVSPTVNRAAFSAHVPSSSRMVSTKRPCASRFLMAHKICCPTLTRSAGEEMRLTDIQSMGSRALMPQPTSQNAPNGSMWVTVQGRMSPGERVSRYSALHSCCALARDSR